MSENLYKLIPVGTERKTPPRLTRTDLVAVTLISITGVIVIGGTALLDGLLKLPKSLEASVTRYSTQRQKEIDQTTLETDQAIAQQQADANQVIAQKQFEASQKQIQQQHELEKLQQQKPLITPRLGITNSLATCPTGYSAVNFRKRPAGEIAYQLPCNSEIYATRQNATSQGQTWQLVYFNGLPGWIASNLIQEKTQP